MQDPLYQPQCHAQIEPPSYGRIVRNLVGEALGFAKYYRLEGGHQATSANRHGHRMRRTRHSLLWAQIRVERCPSSTTNPGSR